METLWTVLQTSQLFDNIPQNDMKRLYSCLEARRSIFPKGSFVFHSGDEATFVYIILSGRIQIISEDFWGNQSIIETMMASHFFGEAYVLAGSPQYLVSVLAAEDTDLLLIKPSRLLKTCSHACEYHNTLIQNISNILARKVVFLTQKMSHLSQRTTREKLMSYFSLCASQEHNSSFLIPYSRQELADYLSVDRSALSHELSRMREKGLIRYHKNQFTLLRQDP